MGSLVHKKVSNSTTKIIRKTKNKFRCSLRSVQKTAVKSESLFKFNKRAGRHLSNEGNDSIFGKKLI